MRSTGSSKYHSTAVGCYPYQYHQCNYFLIRQDLPFPFTDISLYLMSLEGVSHHGDMPQVFVCLYVCSLGELGRIDRTTLPHCKNQILPQASEGAVVT